VIYKHPHHQKKRRWIKDAKGHEDQSELDGRKLSFSLMIVWDFCYFHIIYLMRSQLKVLKVPSMETSSGHWVFSWIHNTTGVFEKDSSRPLGQSDLRKLPLTEMLELSSN